MRHNRKHLDFEINLIPCIDLLSVCICFLLLTAVWLQVDSMNVKQAIGGQASDAAKKPAVWVTMAESGQLLMNVKDSTAVPARLSTQKIGLADLPATLAKLRSLEPSLATALIQPRRDSEYEEIIALMDEFKKAGVNDLGVVPL